MTSRRRVATRRDDSGSRVQSYGNPVGVTMVDKATIGPYSCEINHYCGLEQPPGHAPAIRGAMSMTTTIATTNASVTAPASEFPQPGRWTVDRAHSSASFVARHLVVTRVR